MSETFHSLDSGAPVFRREGGLSRTLSSSSLLSQGSRSPPREERAYWRSSLRPAQTSQAEDRRVADQGSRSRSSSLQYSREAERPESSDESYTSTHQRAPVENTNAKADKPDLLNFKKGWMSKLDEKGEWKRHWFVLTDAGLRYYRDSNAEEVDDVDGEINLLSCLDVSEFQVQKNYGFQIQTMEAVHTLSAMTSGIRRNWIEVLRKSIRPTSVPDVTKLSDDKENSFTQRDPQTGRRGRPEQEVRSEAAPPQRFDYVELAPLATPPSPVSQKGEELENLQAQRYGERTLWFETNVSKATGRGAGPQWPGGVASRKAGVLEGGGVPEAPPTADPEQRRRLEAEIEKRWEEFEKLPLRESRQVPAVTRRGHRGDEALEKECQSLRQQVERLKRQLEGQRSNSTPPPQGYISQAQCEHSLSTMEAAHSQAMKEFQRYHQRELERLGEERERLLAEEAAATAAAMQALKKAHREELARETERVKRLTAGGNSLDLQSLRTQHQSEMGSLRRELEGLSERYSHKCVELNSLLQRGEEREREASQQRRVIEELRRENEDLQTRLSNEIGRLRAFITGQGSDEGSGSHSNQERNSCELEVLLRVKESEVQSLQKEMSCLREEVQTLHQEKRFSSERYHEVYAELSSMKTRSEREISQLREHLRLTLAALREEGGVRNSLGD
ncbi:TRIO and F-actin-binding protein [Acipenser ruthenus]|uniref:TRIO and F-actin-binding protein n=1 Tax=Acipenser ruthenus TaxID=7906 RepID=UPI002740AF31|nr:TRIO and F-actin-binding protein [Acipenser ruthenus]